MKKIWLLRSITFLASFLLFQIQFIIGKIFLANFGGGFMVWGVCMVFFQGMLLLGYLYTHSMVQELTVKKYFKLHFFLLLVPFLFFPGRALALKYPTYGFPMVLDVSINLAATIGLTFFVLSTMSIICQSWLACSKLPQKDNPYSLFAVSNLGSLLALITYPFIFETVFDLDQQQNIWRVFYVIMVLIYLIAMKHIKVEYVKPQAEIKDVRCDSKMAWKWFLYGAAGVTIFLAVTNMITAEIAPLPFLWMVPLLIYLSSYVLNFKERPWFPVWIEKTIHFSLAFGVLLYFVTVRQIAPAMVSMIFMVVFVFIICMFCQRRLYVLRPPKDALTFFYFIVALGGFFGGAITTWIIPLIYVSYAEYFLGLVFLSTAWAMEANTKNMRFFTFSLAIIFVAVLYYGPLLLKHAGILGLICLIVFIFFSFYIIRRKRAVILIILCLLLVLLDFIQPKWFTRQFIYGKRNYYGISRVFEEPGFRLLLHGTIVHGAQFLDPETNFVPLTYYNPQSPPAELLINEDHYKRIGMIGLGTGALAVYERPNQIIDFYELDKDVLYIAKEYFNFLDFSPAKINYIIKDARIGLEENKDKRYHILIVDAFSGDSVPLHLLTLECLDLYRRRITKDGLVLFHLSNRYINLPLAFVKTAAATDAYIALKKDINFKSDWIAITYNKQVFERLLNHYGWVGIDSGKYKKYRPWTDKYSNTMPYFLRADVFSSVFDRWNIK